MSADIKALRRAVKDAEAKAEEASELVCSLRARLREVLDDEMLAHKALKEAKCALKATEPLSKRKVDLLQQAASSRGAFISRMTMRCQRRDDARKLEDLGFVAIVSDGSCWHVTATDAGRAKLAETKS